MKLSYFRPQNKSDSKCDHIFANVESTRQLKTNPDHNITQINTRSNHTGLPDNLKAGIEHLSGFSMDDVKVHYNSSKPPQLGASAFAQDNKIYLGNGEDKYLPHEAWHIVQQKQGRVKPTLYSHSGVAINDDAHLELEADIMGEKARQFRMPEPSMLAHKLDGNRSNNAKQPIALQKKVMQLGRGSYSSDDLEKKLQSKISRLPELEDVGVDVEITKPTKRQNTAATKNKLFNKPITYEQKLDRNKAITKMWAKGSVHPSLGKARNTNYRGMKGKSKKGHASHLFPNRFGGIANKNNMLYTHKKVNTALMGAVENFIASKSSVYLEVDALNINKQQRPDTMVYRVRIKGGSLVTVTLTNLNSAY